MIEKIESAIKYFDFLMEVYDNSSYRDPHFLSVDEMKDCLSKTENKNDFQILRTFENEQTTGIFVLLFCPEDKYIEVLYCVSVEEKAYAELFAWLEQFKGYEVDFVYNPGNRILDNLLRNKNAEILVEQQRMVLASHDPIPRKHNVIEYSEDYREQYLAIHEKEDLYWTGERVLEALDRFRIILALENNEVVGYIDVTKSYEENEIYAVFVKEDYRCKGYATDMVSFAVEKNGNAPLMLLYDIDNPAAGRIYEKNGFVKSEGNNITAFLNIS